MRKLYYIILFVSLFLSACNFRSGQDRSLVRIEIKRYDLLESRYLTTGDFSALQQMNTEYPRETRMLLEDVLQLGEANDPEIYSNFLNFYQDTILQDIIADVEQQYASVSDLNRQLSAAFSRLATMVPELKTPRVYAQIGALNQSVTVGDRTIGISLDKYLGEDYRHYERYYDEHQRAGMNREDIVPDCLFFYIIAQFPMKNNDFRAQYDRDIHKAKVMWLINKATNHEYYDTKYVEKVDAFMKKNTKMTVKELFDKGRAI